MQSIFNVEFLSAQIQNQKPLFVNDKIKIEIVESLHWLVRQQRCTIYGFSILPSELNLIWEINPDVRRTDCQGSLFKFTGHMFKKYLEKNEPETLANYLVERKDRKYHFWNGNPLIQECWNPKFLENKLYRIHQLPCYPKWNLAKVPEEYHWSSAAFYKLNDHSFPWLTSYKLIPIHSPSSFAPHNA
ncbi:MAG: transposase [Bacteroidetes bacterium]|nr:MAG: transposase [Bacteroidota bacterium]